MKRTNTRIGDVFSVKISNTHKKYFQYIANDLTQLNSNVIRAFKALYLIDAEPVLLDIINGDIDFYAHCVIKFGIKNNLWEKVDNTSQLGNIENIVFRGTSDSGSKPGEQIKVSDNWYIWKINDRNFTRVGQLDGKNRKADIGVVVNPYDIVKRMTDGKYSFFYPGFE